MKKFLPKFIAVFAIILFACSFSFASVTHAATNTATLSNGDTITVDAPAAAAGQAVAPATGAASNNTSGNSLNGLTVGGASVNTNSSFQTGGPAATGQPTYTDSSGNQWAYVGNGSWRTVGTNLAGIQGAQTSSLFGNNDSLWQQYGGQMNIWDQSTGQSTANDTEPVAAAMQAVNNPFNVIPTLAKELLTGTANVVLGAYAYSLELVFIPIISVLLSVMGMVVDYTVQSTIVSAAANFTALNATISSVWTIVRDTFNVAFIFILLYISITTILDLTSVNTKKMLKSIIISALFINFSLFTSQIIIDAGNLVAVAFLNQISETTSSLPQTKTSNLSNAVLGSSATSTTSVNLSENIMSGLKLYTIYDYSTNGVVSTLPGLNIGSLIMSSIRIILFAVTGFAFVLIAFLLIGRFVMLIFLMATSPLGFIGGSIPGMAKYAGSWWDSMINQTLVAPVFMFFMLLIIKIASATQTFTGSGFGPSLGDTFTSTGVGASIPTYFNYFLIIFLLFKALSITKSLSGVVGEYAGKIASSIAGATTGLGLAALTDGASLALTQTVGRAGAAIASSDSLKNAASKSGIAGIGARLTLRASTGVSKSSFDVRNTDAGKDVLGMLNKEGIVSKGSIQGRKGGFVEARDEYAKQQKEFAEKQLARKDLSGEQAMKEFLKENGGIAELETASNTKRAELDTARAAPNPDTAKVAKLEKELEEINGKKKLVTDATGPAAIDPQTGLRTEAASNAIKAIIEQQSKAFQKGYANTEEKSWLAGESTLFNVAIKSVVKSGQLLGKDMENFEKGMQKSGFNKAGADKIRNELVKAESDEKKFAALAKKLAKEEKAGAAAGGAGGAAQQPNPTPGTSGGNPAGNAPVI